MNWDGVIPALTTPFDSHDAVDVAALRNHVAAMTNAGCTGVVACGSLGEGATLSLEEKKLVLETCVAAAGDAPVVAGISALSTREAIDFARFARTAGCRGLMVLPPYVYSTDWREMKAHVAAVIGATDLSAMLYNNPIAYRTDFLADQVAELADEFPNLHAIKESSADVRRVTALRARLGDRLRLLVGVDDAIVEGINAGATGWIAGLVNAFPRESVVIFERARRGEDVRSLYEWFLPLLRLDTTPKFVQMIKMAQAAVNMGSERVRPPRLPLVGEERAAVQAVIDAALQHRPSLS